MSVDLCIHKIYLVFIQCTTADFSFLGYSYYLCRLHDSLNSQDFTSISVFFTVCRKKASMVIETRFTGSHIRLHEHTKHFGHISSFDNSLCLKSLYRSFICSCLVTFACYSLGNLFLYIYDSVCSVVLLYIQNSVYWMMLFECVLY